MTTSSLRIAAAGIAIVFAVLTGLFTGIVGVGEPCTVADQPPNQGPGQNQEEVSPTGRRGGAPGSGGPDQPGQDPGQGGDPTQPGPGGGIPGNPDNTTEGELNTETDGNRPLAQPGSECESNGFSLPSALVGFFGVLLAAGAVGALAFARRKEATAPSAAAVSDNGVSATQREQSDGERSTLIQTCIYVRDRATSKALQDRLGWALQEVGVATVSPAGARFDPAHHEAGGSATTNDPSRVGTIAAVEVPGYIDRGVVLRAPVVTVYRQDGQ
ncbi:MAG: hypothetical protein ACRDTU_11775 [Micromonosporaceae bacterium]